MLLVEIYISETMFILIPQQKLNRRSFSEVGFAGMEYNDQPTIDIDIPNNMSSKEVQHTSEDENRQSETNENNVEDLLQVWSTYSKSLSPVDPTLIGIAVEICNHLSRTRSYSALSVFLTTLPNLNEYEINEDILRARIALALHKKDTTTVYNIIENNYFEKGEEIIRLWDDAHYIDEEERLKKPLTPLARFRVRKRYPPPRTVCPSGIRKTSSLPKEATKILREWLHCHSNDPYPSSDEKLELAKICGLTPNQVKTWFANARRRVHKGTESCNKHCRSKCCHKKNDGNYFVDSSSESNEVEQNLSPRIEGSFSAAHGSLNLPNHSSRASKSSGQETECERLSGLHPYQLNATASVHGCVHCPSYSCYPQGFGAIGNNVHDTYTSTRFVPSSCITTSSSWSNSNTAYQHWPLYSPVACKYPNATRYPVANSAFEIYRSNVALPYYPMGNIYRDTFYSGENTGTTSTAQSGDIQNVQGDSGDIGTLPLTDAGIYGSRIAPVGNSQFCPGPGTFTEDSHGRFDPFEIQETMSEMNSYIPSRYSNGERGSDIGSTCNSSTGNEANDINAARILADLSTKASWDSPTSNPLMARV